MNPSIILVAIVLAVVILPALFAGLVAWIKPSSDNGLVYEYQNPRNYRK